MTTLTIISLAANILTMTFIIVLFGFYKKAAEWARRRALMRTRMQVFHTINQVASKVASERNAFNRSDNRWTRHNSALDGIAIVTERLRELWKDLS